jgi:uncharacterized C2H2 Zn-finger protein
MENPITTSFSTQEELNEHMFNVHCKVTCNFCHKIFNSQAKLMKHISKIHFCLKCPGCVKSFDSEETLTSHIQSYHMICTECFFLHNIATQCESPWTLQFNNIHQHGRWQLWPLQSTQQRRFWQFHHWRKHPTTVCLPSLRKMFQTSIIFKKSLGKSSQNLLWLLPRLV